MKVIKQNITDVKRGIIAHGCNSQGVMGAGVAKAIRNKWPSVFEQYKKVCAANNYCEQLLGTSIIVKINQDLYVANCITQHKYGFDKKQYAKPEAIYHCMKQVFEFAETISLPIYTVKIGCGLGGLTWSEDVEPIFEQLVVEHPFVNIFICDI